MSEKSIMMMIVDVVTLTKHAKPRIQMLKFKSYKIVWRFLAFLEMIYWPFVQLELCKCDDPNIAIGLNAKNLMIFETHDFLNSEPFELEFKTIILLLKQTIILMYSTLIALQCPLFGWLTCVSTLLVVHTVGNDKYCVRSLWQ